MDGHRAAQRRAHPDNSRAAIAGLKLTAEPSVFDETIGLNAAVDVDVGTESSPSATLNPWLISRRRPVFYENA